MMHSVSRLALMMGQLMHNSLKGGTQGRSCGLWCSISPVKPLLLI